jgi:hypothetical protein
LHVVLKVPEDTGESHRKIFVKLNLHRDCETIWGAAETGRSSSAEAAAKDIAA